MLCRRSQDDRHRESIPISTIPGRRYQESTFLLWHSDIGNRESIWGSDISPLTMSGDERRKRTSKAQMFLGFSLTDGVQDFTSHLQRSFYSPFCLTFSTVFSLIASISKMILTSSPTSIPPLSNNLLNFMPKSFRLMVPAAVKPARVLPQGS